MIVDLVSLVRKDGGRKLEVGQSDNNSIKEGKCGGQKSHRQGKLCSDI